MCLILFACHQHEDYPLIVAANRDEFYSRSTSPASFWPESPHVLAGCDRQLGGTWFGITRQGRFAAVTNYRDPDREKEGLSSRGVLVRDYLLSEKDPGDWLAGLSRNDRNVKGFNLVVGSAERLFYHSNRGAPPRSLSPGIYGLSNHLLDTPWPKVVRSKKAFAEIVSRPNVSEADLFSILADTEQAPDARLPETGVGLEFERILSAPFIISPDYGTRSSTILLCRRDGRVRFIERTFFPRTGPDQWMERTFSFLLGS
ncbi:MAG: NRDE family protein [Desulfuromonadales bacterium]